VGVLVLIVANFFKNNETSKTASTAVSATSEQNVQENVNMSYELSKRNELKSMLTKMKGVGRVDVMISFESGEEIVPAVNINDGVSSTNEKDNEGGERKTTQNNKGSQVVMTTKGGDSQPVVLKKNNPKVLGVMIVAEGAKDKQVQLDVKNAVASLLGIQSNKVNVYPME
jgi:stage III sporulation protein AG